ncbi:hypothetical protein D3C87_1998590 [compost metagenome]
MTCLAKSRIVNSTGLPMFTGSVTPESIRRRMPSTRSETYWKLRVCCPSPKTVRGSPLRA